MPAQITRASFEPIPPDFDVRAVVESTDSFCFVDRISVDMIKQQGVEQFEKLVLLHVVIGGKPLVVDGFDEILDPWMFTPKWLSTNHGDNVVNARNLTNNENLPLTIGHYLNNMRLLTSQFFDKPDNYKNKNRQRIYLKDIDCPQVWQDKLREHIPPGVFYLNETTGEIGGPGAVDEPTPNIPGGRRKGRGIARAGDLMSSLPPEMRAENLMCYIGHEGTYTPSHREMCASLGQNIMVHASGDLGEDNEPEKPGSSIWFMTETRDRHTVSEYWLSVLGHDIEIEKHFAQMAAWKKAPFKTYVVEQRPGDFILIPPLAPHQVWNRGTRTVKVAWNRTTVETLELALNEALPKARMVCRDEQYKTKAIVYYSLVKYSALLKQAKTRVGASSGEAPPAQSSSRIRNVQKDFKRLFHLYKQVLLSDMFSPTLAHPKPQFMRFEGYVTCAYCRGNIFNRFLTCKACVYALGTEAEEPYDICTECYAMGRSCACISGLTWVEQWNWDDLLRAYEEWRVQIIEIDHGQLRANTPLPLTEERRNLRKRTLAEICQGQLMIRPFTDYRDPKPNEHDEKSEEESLVNEDGTVRRTAKKRSKAWLASHASCHTCLHKHPKWKMAKCTTCDLWYCYGSLFRAHDLMPQTIMEDPVWQCPHCRRVCNTGACRRDPRQRSYEPKGTLLGHDTRKIADARSVEALVDFSISNLTWLRDGHAGPTAMSGRLQKRREEAELAKRANPAFDDRFTGEDEDPGADQYNTEINYSPIAEDESFIDPALRSNDTTHPHSAVIPDNVHLRNTQSPHLGAHDDDSGWRTALYDDNDASAVVRSPTKRTFHDYADDHIKLVQSSNRHKTDKSKMQAKKDAKWQYHRQMEKRQLRQAKRDGKFVQVSGVMQSRRLVVKLPLPSQKLAELEARDLEKRKRTQRDVRGEATESTMKTLTIIQSDVAGESRVSAAVNDTRKGRKPKKARVVLDDDEDFDIRKSENKRKEPVKRRYEEIDVGSDLDGGESDIVETLSASRPRRCRRQGPDFHLVELPKDWKDGRIGRSNKKRQSIPARSNVAQIRPSKSKPTWTSSVDIHQISSDDSGCSSAEDMDPPVQRSIFHPVKSADNDRTSSPAENELDEEEEQTEQSNRIAKLQAARWVEGEHDDSRVSGYYNNVGSNWQLDGVSDTPSNHLPCKHTETNSSHKDHTNRTRHTLAPAQPGFESIMFRHGRRKGKIKIVSAANKRVS